LVNQVVVSDEPELSVMAESLDESLVPKQLLLNLIRAVKEEFGESLVAIFASGSRIRGNSRPSSDLDVHIIHLGEWQQKRSIGPSHSLSSITIDITINPLGSLYSWAATSRAYADFYATGVLLYPREIPEPLAFVVGVAKRTMRTAPLSNIESESHHHRYLHIRRVLDYALQADAADQRAAAVYALSNIATFRLFLSDEHHIRHHALCQQLQAIDPIFANQFVECLQQQTPEEQLAAARILLEQMRPASDSMVGSRT